MKELTPMEAAALVFGVKMPEPRDYDRELARKLSASMREAIENNKELNDAITRAKDLLSRPII